MKIAVLQMSSSDRPEENQAVILNSIQAAASSDFLFTPEVCNCVSMSRKHQLSVLEGYTNNSFLSQIQTNASENQLWVSIGSMAIKSEDPDGRFLNRSVVVDATGKIAGFYDKIHMFDVDLGDGETYCESRGYKRGEKAVLVETPHCTLGLSVCYDVRFPYLYRDLARGGASLITVPSAFAVSTGKAHWETLLRARAIETGCFIVAAAQTGEHSGSGRKTFGHSLVVDPWGEVLLDAGSEPGLHFVDLNMQSVKQSRKRVPSLKNGAEYHGPTVSNS